LTSQPLLQVNATYKQVLGEKPVIDESFPPSDMSFSMKYTEQQAHGNTAMMDAAGASHIEEFSTGGKFTLFMAQVCLSFFLVQEHHQENLWMVLN
jgi:hypothetical protein